MSDPNPYEPPREPEPLTAAKAAKRGIGIVTILVLSPLAIFATLFVSCTVGWIASGTPIDEPEPPLFWVITLVPTALVAAGALFWSIRAIVQRGRP